MQWWRLVGALCALWSLANGAYGAPTASIVGNRIRLANERLALEFDVASGSVRSVIDLRSGRNLTNVESGTYRALWGISLGHFSTSNAPYADNNAAGAPEVAFENGAAEAAVRMTWPGLLFYNTGQRVPGAVVVVRVALRADEALSRWTISVTGLGGLRATDLQFPILGGVGPLGSAGAEHVLVVPDQGGRAFDDPIGQRTNWGEMYPSAHMSMQFAAYHNREAGFYVGVHDPSGQTKQLQWWSPPSPANSAMWIGRHYFPDQPTDTMTLPYEVAVGVFNGNWSAAADLYKQWALQQSWAREAALKPVPEWFRRSSYGSSYCVWNCGFTSSATFASFVEHQAPNYAALGGPSLHFLSGWEKLGAWAYGDALPPFEGWPAFDLMVSGVHAAGNRLRISIGFNKLDAATPLWKSGSANDSFVRGVDGQPVVQTVPIGTNSVHKWSVMSSASAWWRDELVRTVGELARHGVDAVMFDGWPINGVDDDYSSGHPPGRGGNWQWLSWKGTLSALQAGARAINADLLFSTEEAHELLLPYIGFFDKRDTSAEINSYSQRGRPIPLMTYVYKPLMQVGPADYWPWIRASDPDSYHQLVLARTLVWGEHAPFLYSSFKDTSLLAPGAYGLYKVAGEMRRSYGRFLIDGKMLPPLEFTSPTTPVELKGDGFAVPTYKSNAAAVQSAAWRARGGEAGIFLVNIAPRSVTIDLPIDLAALRLAAGVSHRLTIAPLGEPPRISTISASTRLAISMAPQQVVVVTVLPETTAQECLFDWAENAYAQYLAPPGAVTVLATPYHYRYYKETNSYLGTSAQDSHLYYLGPASGQLLHDLGPLTNWLSSSNCDSVPGAR